MADIANVADEIEITPEMIEAGVCAFYEFDSRFDGAEVAVARIFQAMKRMEACGCEPILLRNVRQS